MTITAADLAVKMNDEKKELEAYKEEMKKEFSNFQKFMDKKIEDKLSRNWFILIVSAICFLGVAAYAQAIYGDAKLNDKFDAHVSLINDKLENYQNEIGKKMDEQLRDKNNEYKEFAKAFFDLGQKVAVLSEIVERLEVVK